jgi:hypothetical protein
MKKAKFLIYAAVAATAAIVSSCSNEDVVEQTPQKGRPIVVEASVDGNSRASVATSFTGFKLYGYKDNTEKTNFLDGVNYAKSNSSWVSVGSANWPEGSGNCNFYAISTQGAAGVPDGIDITNLKDGSFSYTVPADVAEQKDILVASQNDVAYNDNAGKIKLGFKHALANVTMQVRFNWKENNKLVVQEDIRDALFSFDYIKIHNVYTSGTYNAATGVWTPTGEPGTITINFAQAPVYKAFNESEEDGIYKTGVKYQDIVLGSAGASLMVMPQTFESYWVNNDPKDNPVPVENAEAAHQPYIEIHGVVYTTSSTTENDTPFNYTPAQLADEKGAGSLFEVLIGEDEYLAQNIYIPLKSPYVFGVNKNYNLRLNILGAFAEDGTTAFTPVEAAGGDNP